MTAAEHPGRDSTPIAFDIPDPLRGGVPHGAEGMVQVIEVR